MKKIRILLSLIPVLAFSNYHVFHDLNVAEKLALIEDKKLVVLFELKTCPWCMKMNSVTLKDKTVSEILGASYITVVLFYGKDNARYFDEFKIKYTPTIWFFESDGKDMKPLTYVPGYVEPDVFAKILRYVYKKPKELFSEYVKKKDGFIGEKKIVEVSEKDADFVLKNDPTALVAESLDDYKTPFNVYVVRDENLAEKLVEIAYRVLLIKRE